MSQIFPNDLIHTYMLELSSRVVAESGIPTDRYHLGKIIFQGLNDHPDFILQIDGETGQSESSGSVLERSVRCALGLRRMGLKTGDVMVLMAPNHLDLAIPFYAALFLGLIIGTDDKNSNKKELQRSFKVSKPKIVFCQSERADTIDEALSDNGLDSSVITFDKHRKYRNFSEFINEETDVHHFRPVNFDTENSIGFLLATCGTTGIPKMVAHTYKSFSTMLPYMWIRDTKFPLSRDIYMILSPIQWISSYVIMLCGPFMRLARLQTSKAVTREHVYELINKYRPTRTTASPPIMHMLLSPTERHRCDFSCFKAILLGGAAVSEKLVQESKEVISNAFFVSVHAATECGVMFTDTTGKSSGFPGTGLLTKLVNPETEEIINQPHVIGEVWVKGPSVFKEYYGNPEETALAFANDNWFKTGDLFYRDENWNFHFVDRIKLMMKYKLQQISPVEIENVIRSHESVVDVAVTGYPDEECGELPTAFVVLRDSHTIAQDIKDLVKASLSDLKQLRGGVVIVDKLPLTPSTKIDRKALKRLVLDAIRE